MPGILGSRHVPVLLTLSRKGVVIPQKSRDLDGAEEWPPLQKEGLQQIIVRIFGRELLQYCA